VPAWHQPGATPTLSPLCCSTWSEWRSRQTSERRCCADTTPRLPRHTPAVRAAAAHQRPLQERVPSLSSSSLAGGQQSHGFCGGRCTLRHILGACSAQGCASTGVTG
jgi:hypothetical protein